MAVFQTAAFEQGIIQAGAGEVGLGKIEHTQVGVAQVGTGKIGLGKVEPLALARQLQPAQPDARQLQALQAGMWVTPFPGSKGVVKGQLTGLGNEGCMQLPQPGQGLLLAVFRFEIQQLAEKTQGLPAHRRQLPGPMPFFIPGKKCIEQVAGQKELVQGAVGETEMVLAVVDQEGGGAQVLLE